VRASRGITNGDGYKYIYNNEGNMKLRKVCGNCFDFNKEDSTCKIRNIIHPDKTRTPMKRSAGKCACKAFMEKVDK